MISQSRAVISDGICDQVVTVIDFELLAPPPCVSLYPSRDFRFFHVRKLDIYPTIIAYGILVVLLR